MLARSAGCLMLATAVVALAAAGSSAVAQPTIDITRAVIVAPHPASYPVEYRAAVMLREEVEKRSGISWPIVSRSRPSRATTTIYVGSSDSLALTGALTRRTMKVAAGKRGGPLPEGYALITPVHEEDATEILAVGNDRRGALYAVGRLLRAMYITEGKIAVPAGLDLASAPRYPIRGFQLGHRALNDTIDAWTISDYEQYIRDLIVFGANSIELLPALAPTEDLHDGVMKTGRWEIALAMSELLDSYDLDVWMYMHFPESAFKDPHELQEELDVRRRLFAACKRIDDIFVPTREKGGTDITLLMPCLERLAAALRDYHPGAGLWVSTQGLEPAQLDYFYAWLQTSRPTWLTGVVYGPWSKDTLQHTREAVPRQYLVRRYPDIGHAVRC